MVERYRHGDPMPKDPWIIRQLLKHQIRSAGALIIFTGVVVTVATSAAQAIVNHGNAKLQAQLVRCMKPKAAKISAEMHDNGFNPDAAMPWSNRKAAVSCCIKMGRIPVESAGALEVLCLSPDVTPVMYKSNYISMDDEL